MCSSALNANAPAAYRGLDRFEARKRVLADLEAAGLVVTACVVAAIATHTVLRLFDVPVPTLRRRPRLNVAASSRGYVFLAGTAMTLWILAWLAALGVGLVFLFGL